MKCQILFSGKSKKNIISLLSAGFAHIMIKVNKVIILCKVVFYVHSILLLSTGPLESWVSDE